MTALRKYQRLECPGLWREQANSQRREVAVGFREATLVLADPRTGTALAQWSLPAVRRANPGSVPAVYVPAEDSPESLEVDDEDMIAALETVRGAVARARPRPGRLRAWLVGGATAAVLGLGLFWLPGALVAHTASVLPGSTRAEIGLLALADLSRLTGAPCTTRLGQGAEELLSERVFGPGGPALVVMRDGIETTASLPGGLVLLSRALVEGEGGPEAVAGFALAEIERSRIADPMVPILRHAGPVATFRLLTTGVLAPEAVHGYGEVLLSARPVAVDEEILLGRFSAAQIPSSPYAYALDPSGETVLGLIEADPFRGVAPRPVLEDGDWISLQAICG